jgi:hypothetical protein
MKRNHSLLFSADTPMGDLRRAIESAFAIEFEERASDYVGDYLKYVGPVADRISIEPVTHVGPQIERLLAGTRAQVVVVVQLDSGKNADKKAKCEDIKLRLLALPGVSLMKETIREEP